jgi:hypothetical protein
MKRVKNICKIHNLPVIHVYGCKQCLAERNIDHLDFDKAVNTIKKEIEKIERILQKP